MNKEYWSMVSWAFVIFSIINFLQLGVQYAQADLKFIVAMIGTQQIFFIGWVYSNYRLNGEKNG